MRSLFLPLLLALLSGCAYLPHQPASSKRPSAPVVRPSPTPAQVKATGPAAVATPSPAAVPKPTPAPAFPQTAVTVKAPPPAEAPTPTPTPKPIPKPTPTPAPTPEKIAKVDRKPPQKAVAQPPVDNPPATPPPVRPPVAKAVSPTVPETQEQAPESVVPAYAGKAAASGSGGPEKQRYFAARDKAVGDPQVVKLHKAMDSTADGDSYKTAARAYIKALFSKIRALEPELKESLGRKEEAYLRRIDDGKVLAD